MKYIVIGNNAEWCQASWSGETDNKNFIFTNDIVPIRAGTITKKLCEIHYSRKFNEKINFPGKQIWYKKIENALGIDRKSDEEYILIIYDWCRLSRDAGFWRYLKKRHKKLITAYLFTNVISRSGASLYGITDKLKENFDMVFTFDAEEAAEYGFRYFPLIYTVVDTGEKAEKVSDLFYVGQAKDEGRYKTLIEIYEAAKSEGLVCDFNIVGVPEENQKYAEDISYNTPLPYYDVIKKIKTSDCLVDVIQQQSSGMTIKVCEAVLYDKKLITTNGQVKKESFYSDNMIKIWSNRSDSIKSFLSYKWNAYTDADKAVFSPQRLYSIIINEMR